MKKRILIVAIIALLIPGSLLAQNAAVKMLGVMNSASVGGSCNASTNEVGDRTAYNDTATLSYIQHSLYCVAYTPDCSGNTVAAYLYHRGTTSTTAKVALYAKSGTAPNGEALLTSTGTAMASSTDKSWATQSVTSYAVSASTEYWVCILAEPDWDNYVGNGTSNRYSKATGSYTMPATLPTSGWTGPTADRKPSVYISVGP